MPHQATNPLTNNVPDDATLRRAVQYHELKEEFDEKLIDCVRSFPVIYHLSKKSYMNKIAKDNAWKRIATYLERDGKFSV